MPHHASDLDATAHLFDERPTCIDCDAPASVQTPIDHRWYCHVCLEQRFGLQHRDLGDEDPRGVCWQEVI